MIAENPFRLSKPQLTWRVLLLIGLGVITTKAGCGNPFGLACFIVAGMFGALLAYKMWRDFTATSGRRVTQYTPIRPTIEKSSDGTDVLEVPAHLNRDH